MQDRGELAREADFLVTRAGLPAAAQGGLLLAQTARTTTPLEVALDLAVDAIQARLEANC